VSDLICEWVVVVRRCTPNHLRCPRFITNFELKRTRRIRLFNKNMALWWGESPVHTMWFLPSASNINMEKFKNERRKGGGVYDSLLVDKCAVTYFVTRMNGATWFLLSLSATQRNHCQGNELGDDKGEMSPNVLDFIQTLRIDSIGVEYVGEATRSWNTTTFDVNLLTLLLCCISVSRDVDVLCIYVVSLCALYGVWKRTCWYKGPSLVGSLAGAAHLKQ